MRNEISSFQSTSGLLPGALKARENADFVFPNYWESRSQAINKQIAQLLMAINFPFGCDGFCRWVFLPVSDMRPALYPVQHRLRLLIFPSQVVSRLPA